MTIASFEDLCAGFCEIAKVPAPPLQADAQGLIAFHVILRDVTVNLVHCPERCADHAFILFEFGPMGQDGADRCEALQALLDANFLPLQVHPPVFSRNPATGDALLQYVYPFFEATPTGLLELIDDGVEMALRWRQSRSVRQRGHGDHAATGPAPAMLSGFA